MPKAKEPVTGAAIAQAQQDASSEGIDSFELPRSLIVKLARASQVPDNTKFSKEVILAILKASTVFINYLAANAHEVASQKQHKSISASDVLRALEQAEFADIAKTISGELQVYREVQKSDKRKGGKGKAKDTSETASTSSKGKGKAKAASSEQDTPGGTPTIVIPGGAASASASRGPPAGGDGAVDEDQEMADQDQEDEDEEDEDMEEDEDEGEPEEPEDTMALEEEDLQRDARGVDQPGERVDDE
ncbi:histone-fold-containing protein [Epithele typhae]|uniref:histone-fold-containing protein n=1 Tax=Epithele typhae TaxID=378194 RepID=UPI0020086B42|nr:histone-fold-containing protein [Epithele typhae]KAH9913818.1 histone-fold-containing protein [Epithele typhae]